MLEAEATPPALASATLLPPPPAAVMTCDSARADRGGVAGIAGVARNDGVRADGEAAGAARRGAGVAGAGAEREGGAAADRIAAVGEADVAGRVVGAGDRCRERTLAPATAGLAELARVVAVGAGGAGDDLRQRRAARGGVGVPAVARHDAVRTRGELVMQLAVLLLPLPVSATALHPLIALPSLVKPTLPVGLVPTTAAVNVTFAPASDELAERGRRRRRRRPPAAGLDLGDARPGAARGRDVDADAIGGERREGHGALDQVVASDAEDDPSRAGPALHREVGVLPQS